MILQTYFGEQMAEVSGGKELFSLIHEAITKLRGEIVTKVSEDSVENIKKESHGKFQANLSIKPDGFIIGEIPKTDQEKENQQQVERETQAYGKQFKRLSDQAYVTKLLKG